MNPSRHLFAIPVVFFAAITAAACSSSSNPATGNGSGTGTGGAAPQCTTLSECCAELPTGSVASCAAVVSANNGTNCESQLTIAQSDGFCKGGSSGTGTSHTSATTGTSNTAVSSATSGTTATGTPTGCNPKLPAGFVAATKTAAAATSCTASTLNTLVEDCFDLGPTGTANDAGNAMNCPTDVMGACGSCAITAYTAATWGPLLLIPETAAGTDLLYPFGDPGPCVAKLDPTNGPACKTAYEALVQCELASCVSNCPIASPTDTTGTNNLLGTFDQTSGTLTEPGCIENADNTACSTYAMTFETACATDLGDGSASTVFGKCGALGSNLDLEIGDVCGGADAGL